MNVVDIGSSYGFYSLNILNNLNGSGCLWSFEPDIQTFQYFKQSLIDNNFNNCFSYNFALSNFDGNTNFNVYENTELNRLNPLNEEKSSIQEIKVCKLDSVFENEKIPNIDFVKIDVEGEENNVFLGGKKFFTENSPLVMFEIKASSKFIIPNEIKKLGYKLYELFPSLNILIPFDESKERII
jgi:FkbM family methyltransferase